MAWYYNVNDDMDKKTSKRFDDLSDKNKDILEKEFEAREDSGNPLSKREIKDFISIKEERKQVDFLSDMWNQGKFFGQKEGYKGAEQNFKDEVENRFNKIRGIKQANPESQFIQEAKGTIQIDPDAGIMKASVFPSFKDIQTAWGKFTGADDTPVGLSTDVYEPDEPEAYEQFAKDPTTYKGIETLDLDDPELNQYINELGPVYDAYSDIYPALDPALDPVDIQKRTGMKWGDAKTVQEYFANNPELFKGFKEDFGRRIDKTVDAAGGILESGKNIGLTALGHLMGFPPGLLAGASNILGDRFEYKPAEYGVGQHSIAALNQMNALGGYYSGPARTARRNLDPRRIATRRDAKTLRNLQLNYERMGLNQDQINRKIQDFQTVTGQIAGGAGAIAEGRATQLANEVAAATAKRDIQQFTGGNYEAPSVGQQTSGRADISWEHDPFAEGGRVRFSKGGIVGLWRELSSL